MKVELETLVLEIDDAFTSKLTHHETGSVWVAGRSDREQPPILNFALSELTDLEEAFGEEVAPEVPDAERYLAMVRIYFATKRVGVESFEDSELQVAGRLGYERVSTSKKELPDGRMVELFHLFVNVPLDDHFFQEFSADCLLADRSEFEPKFRAAIGGAELRGTKEDRMRLIEPLNEEFREQDARIDELLARAEALSSSQGELPEPLPFPVPEPFVPPEGREGERFQMGDVALDVDDEETGWLVTSFTHELQVTLAAKVKNLEEAQAQGLACEYGDGTLKLEVGLKGVYGPGGVPTGTFHFVDDRCETPYLHMGREGLESSLHFDGTLQLRDGWLELRGRLACSYDDSRPSFDVHICRCLEVSGLDWSQYNFTGQEELNAAPPALVRRLYLRQRGMGVLPAKVLECRGLTHLSVAHDRWGKTEPLEIPEGFGRLTELQHLSLAGFAIGALPSGIERMERLEHLNLDQCELGSLPSELWGLPRLSYLSLDGNGLKALPTRVSLPELQNLSLRGNELVTLPEAFMELPKLRRLDLCDNPWVSLPDACNGQRVEIELSSAEKRRLLDFEYRGADGSGLVPWDNEAYYAASDPALARQVDQVLQDPDLVPRARALASTVKRAVGLSNAGEEDYGTVGQHRFGGMPDLPEGVTYPRYLGRDGDGKEGPYAYEFIAQINCRELAGLQEFLPRTGMLYFFLTTLHDLYGGSAIRPAKVLYFDVEPDGLLSGRELSIREDEYFEMMGDAYGAFRAEARPMPSPPQFYAARQNPHLFLGPAAPLLDDEDFMDDLVMDAFQYPLEQAYPHDHAINAYGFTQHEDPEHQASLVLKGNPEDWTTLLKVSSAGDFQWGDAGDLFFVIHKSDLARRDFSNVFCTLESS